MCPLVAQAAFVRYLLTLKAAPIAKGSCCDAEARRLEKETMLV